MTVLEFKQDTAETNQPSAAISVRNVLYATDFSATSDVALPYASAICRKFGSTLHVAHILSDTSLLLMTGGVEYATFELLYEDAIAIAKEKVEAVQARLGGIPSRSHVRHGQVWKNLSGIVAENNIDLIVVGTHGRTGLGKLMLGSAAEDILRHAPCPVLTVGPKIRGHAKLPEYGNGSILAPVKLELQHILCAMSLAPGSQTLAPIAIALAEKFEARLTLMRVLEDYAKLDTPSGTIEDGVRQLQAVVGKDAKLAYEPEIVIEFGSPWSCIVKKAAEREADLIVLGARSVANTTRLPWSTVHQVVAHANCPVLTVRV